MWSTSSEYESSEVGEHLEEQRLGDGEADHGELADAQRGALPDVGAGELDHALDELGDVDRLELDLAVADELAHRDEQLDGLVARGGGFGDRGLELLGRVLGGEDGDVVERDGEGLHRRREIMEQRGGERAEGRLAHELVDAGVRRRRKPNPRL